MSRPGSQLDHANGGNAAAGLLLPRSRFSPRVIAVILILLFISLGWTFFWLLMDERAMLQEARRRNMESNAQLALSLVRALHHQEQDGLLARSIAQQQALHLLAEMRYGPQQSCYFYILDTRGFMLMHPLRPDLEGTDVRTLTDADNRPFITDLVLNTKGKLQSGFTSYSWHWIGGSGEMDERLAYSTQFEPWGWVLVTEVTTTDIDEMIAAELAQQAFILLAVSLLLALVIAVTLRRLVLSSVDRLMQFTQQLQLGDLSARVMVNPMDEMGDFANALNQMAAGLQMRNRQLRQTQRAAVFALAKLAEARDNETGEHLLRVREYSALLARQLMKSASWRDSISDQFIEHMYDAVMLHDIGKVAIPDKILLKPDTLDEGERAIMMSHTLIGAKTIRLARLRMQADSGFLKMAEQIARSHHENWDGNGYVEMLAGEDIPLAARIFTIADVYDALTTRRPYKRAYTHEEALGIMHKERGKRFDPTIFEVFVEISADMDRLRREFSEETEYANQRPMPLHELM